MLPDFRQTRVHHFEETGAVWHHTSWEQCQGQHFRSL